MYQQVQKVECVSPRPVLILGPLVEASKDMLVKEAPARFCRCPPGELVYTPKSVIVARLEQFGFQLPCSSATPLKLVTTKTCIYFIYRDYEGISAGDRARSEGLRVHRLQTTERTL